jgi:hypothetical protein
MNQEILSSEVHNKDNLCEAVNCNAIATREISVNAGNYGLISLNLCRDCVKKFQVKGETDNE